MSKAEDHAFCRVRFPNWHSTPIRIPIRAECSFTLERALRLVLPASRSYWSNISRRCATQPERRLSSLWPYGDSNSKGSIQPDLALRNQVVHVCGLTLSVFQILYTPL